MSPLYRPIQIIIADDHEIFRDGFSVLLKKNTEIELIGDAENGRELIALALKLKPDVIIMDIKMPVLNGIEATKYLSKELPETGIIALSMYDEENAIVEMLEAGAKGYLIKNAPKEEIISAIKAVYQNQTYYCRHTSNKLVELLAKSNFNPHKKIIKPEFSEKEITVIKLICKEYTNKEIGDFMKLSKRTIESHREKILEKLKVKNTAGIVVYAIKNYLFKIRI